MVSKRLLLGFLTIYMKKMQKVWLGLGVMVSKMTFYVVPNNFYEKDAVWLDSLSDGIKKTFIRPAYKFPWIRNKIFVWLGSLSDDTKNALIKIPNNFSEKDADLTWIPEWWYQKCLN